MVSPNPATDVVNVQGLDEGSNRILLLDAGGKLLTAQAGTGNTQSLHIGSYPKGIYIVRVISANGTVVNVKVVKN